MTTLRESVAQALDALTKIHPCNMSWETGDAWLNAVHILREALAQPAPEPVAWMDRDGDIYPMPETEGWRPPHKLLYTHPPQHQEANPVVWQFRMRPDWVLDKDFWEPWTNCTKEQAADYQRVPHLHDWTYESRSLYTHPPQRKPLTDDEICKLWDSHTIEVFGKIGINPVVFARYLERAHGIGERE